MAEKKRKWGSVRLGRELQQVYPQIADMYRTEKSHREIARELGIGSEYDVNLRCASEAVRLAITGHSGGKTKVKPFVGLIPDEDEREELARRLKSRSGRRAYQGGEGTFSLGGEKLREARSKGGRASYEQRKGIHAQTSRQREEIGHQAAQARGEIPWADEEKNEAYQLSLQREYQIQARGHSDLRKIAIELNERYHNGIAVRTNRAVGRMIRQVKRSLEEKL